jgi:DNA-binding response OmpR family regulator
MAKVLIIEDDDVIARGMARHLGTAGFDAVGVARRDRARTVSGSSRSFSTTMASPRHSSASLTPRRAAARTRAASLHRERLHEVVVRHTLAREQGRVLTRDELLQRVWGRRATHRDRTVDVFIRKLREKVDRRAPRHTFIHTRYGVGYKLEAEPK